MNSASRSFCFPLLAAALFGLTGVALGAFGAHGLKATLIERGMSQAWETAARYHLFHALGLLGIAAWIRAAPNQGPARLMSWVAVCWSIGILVFSGSLYWMALGGPGKVLGPVTPLGGVAFLAGWALVAVAAFFGRNGKP